MVNTDQSKGNLGDFFKNNWLLFLAIIYVISPIDILPDSLPLIGNLDDSALLVLEVVKQYVDYKKSKKKIS
ncbi:MAG: hypothetical protein UT34_C0001G0079 [candidate division WS6 bacterium GW2011_GWF2_39_15]|uniref:DUF1232 domain-containing protein n=1 Tax=candidate division WS6 bacterium GW2011_GWF2_39_15 TaxID=1619100 RepID=A0A0G0MPP9_9BACT|nr:MAG: hypothetical protein UT34_C0001G0079 [candidate division WS6 bacterium GW2011_GWF2_39_15]